MSFIDDITAKLPLGKKSDTPEYFFALNIGSSEISAAVWGLVGNKVDILGRANTAYEGNSDLLDKSHHVLDKAIGALEIEPEKILFGVPEQWSIDDSLKDPYLRLLSGMLKEYDLKPLAYVTTVNAVSFFLQKQEGTPPTAILLGIGEQIEVSISKGGKIVGSKSAKRSNELFEDIEKTLGQFTEIEVLPSRILLYSTKSGEDLERIKDDLMSYPWMQQLSFLHFPKIDVLDENVCLESIIFSGAIELNPQVDIKHSFPQVKETPKTVIGHKFNRLTVPTAKKDALKDESDGLGFVKGDIKQQKPMEEPEEDRELDSPAKSSVIVKDFDDLEEDQLISPDEGSLFEEEVLPARPKESIIQPAEIKKNLLKINVFKNGLAPKFLILPVLLAAAVAAYILFTSASVTLLVEPQVLERDAEVIADPKVTSVDEAKKIIPGEIVETTITGSGKGAATGKKEIGDPAKGKIIIYNKTNSAKTFSQGTTLTDSSGLKFTLDSSAQVASESSTVGAEGEMTKWGKVGPVGATAVKIGPEGNISAGTELTVAGLNKDQFVAKVDEVFSGGTSKTVTVVTSDDQKKLQAQVTSEVRQKAEEDLKGKMKDGKKIIADAFLVVDQKNSFSKQVNDAAGEFSLNSTVRLKGTSYSDNDLRTIVSKLVETNVPEGFALNLQDSETQADVAKVEKDGRLVFHAKFKAKMMPKFNLEDLKGKIKGKNKEEAANILKSLANVTGTEIIIKPNFPKPLSRLPFLTKNISINISPK